MCCNIVLESFWVFWEWAVNFAVKKPDLKILAQFGNFRQVRGGQNLQKSLIFTKLRFMAKCDLKIWQYSSRVILGILGVSGQLCCEKTRLENFGPIWKFSTGPGWSKISKNHWFSLSWDSWLNVLQYSSRVILGILGVSGQLCCEKTRLENFGPIWKFSTGPGWSKSPKITDFH